MDSLCCKEAREIISKKNEIMAESTLIILGKSKTMAESLMAISEKAEITEFCKILAEKFGGKEKSA
jgi:hypothetical protein